MHRTNRRRTAARLALTGAALWVALTLGAVPQAGAQEVGVAARVNDAEISVFRLERHFEDYLMSQARNVGAIRHPDVFRRLKREALDQLIDKELLWQEAQRRHIEVSDEAVRAERAAIAATYDGSEAFRRRLSESGFDDAGYEAYLRRELAARRAYDELIGDVTVSDEEVRAMLEAEPPPEGMAPGEAERQVRAYLTAKRRAEAGHAALQTLREAARIELRTGY